MSRAYQPEHWHPRRDGFTLAEVVVVSVVLTVLLTAVWSLLSLQQRTLERGQRLSRQSRVTLAIQRLFQDDLARTVLTQANGRSARNVAVPRPAAENVADDRSTLSSSFADLGEIEGQEELVAPQFLFAGGTDWLIVDVRRPAYQLGGFDKNSATGDDNELGSTSWEPATPYSRGDPDSLPVSEPTPFERVIYVWLTDEEIAAVTGMVFGYEDKDLAGANNANRVAATGSQDGTSTLRSNRPETPIADLELEAAAELPKRTLLRIRTDWSWPRESEDVGTTWSEALATDSPASDPSGLDEDFGSATPARLNWLRRLLWSTQTGYRQFHLQVGSAVRQGQEMSEADDLAQTPWAGDSFADESSVEGVPQAESADSNRLLLIPNSRKPQVDWFPEIAAGKFQYFDGTQWQDSFASSDDARLPWAVRLEYEVDSDRYPAPIDFANQSRDQQTAADSLLTIAPRTDRNFQDDTANRYSNALIGQRPEFPQVVVWTYRQQASRRSLAYDSLTGTNVAAEADSAENISGTSQANATGFAEAFQPSSTPETGGR
ncbi:MAG: prepilin-type N-terminal cleavage/methylation domain-containing protein [Pirellulaceae bacterium]|nr:prepilin-type N-terminal cleavage/methylation domain-containing protein [Pirellulaceae bacterium]